MSAKKSKKRKRENALGFLPPNELVTFKIGKGEDARTFTVHKEVACKHSSVLGAAFNGDSIEGQTETYELGDTSAGVCIAFVQWLYSQKINLTVHVPGKCEENEYGSSEHAKECRRQDRALVGIWLLGQKLLISNLQDYVMGVMVEVSNECGAMDMSLYKEIYQSTTPGSPLRRLIVDQCIRKGSFEAYKEDPEYFPHEMLLDLVTQLHRVTPLDEKGIMVEDYYVKKY